jgi:hypothetical protein
VYGVFHPGQLRGIPQQGRGGFVVIVAEHVKQRAHLGAVAAIHVAAPSLAAHGPTEDYAAEVGLVNVAEKLKFVTRWDVFGDL